MKDKKPKGQTCWRVHWLIGGNLVSLLVYGLTKDSFVHWDKLLDDSRPSEKVLVCLLELVTVQTVLSLSAWCLFSQPLTKLVTGKTFLEVIIWRKRCLCGVQNNMNVWLIGTRLMIYRVALVTSTNFSNVELCDLLSPIWSNVRGLEMSLVKSKFLRVIFQNSLIVQQLNGFSNRHFSPFLPKKSYTNQWV